MKVWKYLTGMAAGLAFLGAVEAEPYTRKELGIPESQQKYFMREGINQDGVFIKQYDTNNDGLVDMEEAYYYTSTKMGTTLPMDLPFGIWFDLDGNKGVSYDKEVFYSPLMDEDWVQMDPKNLNPTDLKKETKC